MLALSLPAKVRKVTEAGVWLPSRLFAGSEVGLAYDFGDAATLFSDSAGTSLATSGSGFGLVLDKSKGLVRGVEVLANPGPNFTSATEWGPTAASSTLAVVDGAIVATRVASASAWMLSDGSVTLTAGKSYEVLVEFASPDARPTYFQVYDNTASASIGTLAASSPTTRTSARFVVHAKNTGPHMFIGAQTATDANGTRLTLYSYSVREIPGNHATQATTASKAAWWTTYAAFDLFDDFITTAAGGGGTTGILLCAGLRPGGAGTARTIWSDRGTNTGYRLSLNASNQLVLSAGNGTAYTEVIGPVLTAGTDYVVQGWHDGANLRVRVGLGAATSAAFGTATAGTATTTIGRDNDSASGLFGDRLYRLVYRKNDASTASERDQLARWVAAGSGVTL